MYHTSNDAADLAIEEERNHVDGTDSLVRRPLRVVRVLEPDVQKDLEKDIASKLIGVSPTIVQLRRLVLRLAEVSLNVVIYGETGVGKELVARSLHEFGSRSHHPFVAVNCAAVPETIFESEFFGHEAGAFTGATSRRIGRLEQVGSGTLFLDEIESMPLSLQVKVLRAFQEKSFERVGSQKSVPFRARIVAASKANLFDELNKGRFREDLLYRLNVAEIVVPPLRRRAEDIPILFDHFVEGCATEQGQAPPAVDRSTNELIRRQRWPGNVRQLKSFAECYAFGIEPSAMKPSLLEHGDEPDPIVAAPDHRPLGELVADFEKRAIEAVLASSAGDIRSALKLLGIPRRTLNEKMARYNIDRRSFLGSKRKSLRLRHGGDPDPRH